MYLDFLLKTSKQAQNHIYSHAALCNTITRGDPASMHTIKKKMDPRVKPEDDSKL